MVHWYPPFFYFPGTKFPGPKLLLNISEHQKECGHMTAVLRHTYLTKKIIYSTFANLVGM